MSFLIAFAARFIGGKLAGMAVYGVIGLLIAGTLGGTFLALKRMYINEGWNLAIAAIARKDKAAVDAANKARDAVRACTASGGVWNTTGSGVCERR